MKNLILFLILPIGTYVQAQYRVALNHLGTTTIFSGNQPFIDAYNASVDGDTIYLPGAQLSVPGLIDKRLTIFGAGIFPDSTVATNKTILNGSISLGANADKTHLEGLYINGDISFSYEEKIDSVTIRRNYFGTLSISGTNSSTYSNGVLLAENYLAGAVNLQHASNAKVYNNLFQTIQNCHSNAWVANNLSYYLGWGSLVTNATETLFENNIFQWGWGLTNVINCTFINNAFENNPTGDATNTWINNYVNQNWSSLFVDFQPISNYSTADYHLQNPASYPGTSGGQIGLYGGYAPIKEGAVPQNPHIVNKTIAPQTDVNGNLNINIKVGAQDN